MYILLQKYRLRVEHTACSLLKKNLYMKFINTQCLAYPLLSLLSSSFIVCVLKFPTSTRLPQLLLNNFFFSIAYTFTIQHTYVCMYVRHCYITVISKTVALFSTCFGFS